MYSYCLANGQDVDELLCTCAHFESLTRVKKQSYLRYLFHWETRNVDPKCSVEK